jgi:hypothetical protein
MATNGEAFPWDDIRLPSFIQPVRYDIELTPNLTSLWVKGIEKFFFTVSKETNFIVFHSKVGWANIRHIFNTRIMNIFDLLFEYSNIIRIFYAIKFYNITFVKIFFIFFEN